MQEKIEKYLEDEIDAEELLEQSRLGLTALKDRAIDAIESRSWTIQDSFVDRVRGLVDVDFVPFTGKPMKLTIDPERGKLFLQVKKDGKFITPNPDEVLFPIEKDFKPLLKQAHRDIKQLIDSI